MENIKGSQTEKNLLKAFAGESQAHNRYTYFAKVAKNEGFEQISEFFLETAEQEKNHAKSFFKFLDGGDVEITAMFPAGKIGTTAENLKAAAKGENEEWTKLYPEFARIAEEEGFNKVSSIFKLIAKIEEVHEARYLKLLKNIEEGKVFAKDKPVKWQCKKCGYVHEGVKALANCPACNHPQAYFEVMKENY